jgi:hypothetical protein
MATQTARNYNCKNEELPVICGFVATTLNRDLTDFSTYSPKFNQTYLTSFREKIDESMELVNPKEETAELKAITDRLYTTMNNLADAVNRLEGYVKMAKGQIPITLDGFGFPLLRKKIRNKDAEGILQNLHVVIDNAGKYKQLLEAQGFTDAQLAQMETLKASISADNTLQYEILTRRIELVKTNMEVLNSLFDRLTELCNVGKILYKKTAPEKVQEYTFTYLLKKVRHIAKPKLEEVK